MAVALKSRTAPGTDRIYVICLVHLILCVISITLLTPGSESLEMGGVLVSPILQWWNAAFAALSLSVIILAAVGVLYLIEWHLDVYAAVLVVSILIDLFWFGTFLIFGSACSSGEATMSCSFNSGAVILAITAIVLFKIYALWAVLKAKRAVRIKYNEELLPYLRQSLSTSLADSDRAGEEAAELAGMMGGEKGAFAFGGAAGLAGASSAKNGTGVFGRQGNKSVSFASAPQVMSIGGTGSCCGSAAATSGYGAVAPNSSNYGSAANCPVAIPSSIAPTGTVGMMGSQTPTGTTAMMGFQTPGMMGSQTPTGTAGMIGSQVAVPTVPPSPTGSAPQGPMAGSALSMPPLAAPAAAASAAATTAQMPVPGTLGTAGAEAIFEQMDKDGDGFITRAEWETFRSRTAQSPPGSSPTVGSDSTSSN